MAQSLPAGLSRQALAKWLPALFGLAVLYGSTFAYSWKVVWQQDDYAYGPLVFAVCCWMLWRAREQLLAVDTEPADAIGWALLGFGLSLYVVGRSQDIYIVEMGSLSPVAAGTFAIVSGKAGLKVARFPAFFLLFMLPLPNPLVDAVTGPLKQVVSACAEYILYHAGYPIARSGVLLSIDQYQLLVADACSGMHSMFSLSAVGVLYLYLSGTRPWWRNALLAASILPIAFLANVVRVVFLVLVTYHFGEAAGQGFIHKFAGMVLFFAALMMLSVMDAAIEILLRFRQRKSHDETAE